MGSWRRFAGWLLGALAALIGTVVLLVGAANPYGNLPLAVLGPHVIMDDNQRYQYPAIIRSGRYDSLVIGTSTARLLEPAELERILGGRFTNLALNSGTPWEQWQIALLFQRAVKSRGTLLIGLDHVWCDADADRRRITPRGFPGWMFDDDPWNDLLYMLNPRAVEIAGRRIGHALGLVRARWPDNGYEIFVPPESRYDLVKARSYIYGPAVPGLLEPETPAFAADDAARAGWHFPAHAWLEDLLMRSSDWRHVVMMFTPVHVAAQPRPGSFSAVREAECKARTARLASVYGVPLVDFRIPSPITEHDKNYWDALHVRVPVATDVVRRLGRALREGRNDPDGSYRVLIQSAPRAQMR